MPRLPPEPGLVVLLGKLPKSSVSSVLTFWDFYSGLQVSFRALSQHSREVLLLFCLERDAVTLASAVSVIVYIGDNLCKGFP